MTEIQDIFKNIDFETGVYKIKDLELKIRDLTIDEMEALQDREAALSELDKNMPPSQILVEARKWQQFILTTAFGKELDMKEVKKKLNASEFKQMIEEVFVFLGRYSGPQGANEYIASLTAKEV